MYRKSLSGDTFTCTCMLIISFNVTIIGLVLQGNVYDYRQWFTIHVSLWIVSTRGSK